MIIKIIPEEGEKVTEVEHHNVKEFFIFGNKKDTDGDFVDFHDWKGSYRYLMGSLAYFNETIKDEKTNPSMQQVPPQAKEIKLAPPTEDIEVESEVIEEVVEEKESKEKEKDVDEEVSNVIELKTKPSSD